MSDSKLLRPSEAAQRLGVRTLVIVEAMHDRRLPRVRLTDGTLGIPEGALETFDVPAPDRVEEFEFYADSKNQSPQGPGRRRRRST